MDINDTNTNTDNTELYKEYKKIFDNMTGSSQILDPELISGAKKLISCRHEIIFNINARVIEEDEVGKPIATTRVATQNYHIPVPSDKDYNIYMNAFFEHLEKCLSQSAQKSTEDSND